MRRPRLIVLLLGIYSKRLYYVILTHLPRLGQLHELLWDALGRGLARDDGVGFDLVMFATAAKLSRARRRRRRVKNGLVTPTTLTVETGYHALPSLFGLVHQLSAFQPRLLVHGAPSPTHPHLP